MAWKVHQKDSAGEWASRKPIKLVWTDPPFGTGKKQTQGGQSWMDTDFKVAINTTCSAIKNMLPHMTDDGVIAVCADYRIVHDVVSVMRWDIYHQGDVIWTFGLGRPRTSWWPVRHNTIATFTMKQSLPDFDNSALPREERKAPKPGYEGDKAAGSVWDYTLSNTASERVGYPNQKPLAIIEPFVLAHTKPGDIVADPFCGSGSTGVAAIANDRHFIGQDANPEAVKITKRRLRSASRR